MEPNNSLPLSARLREVWMYLPFLLGSLGIMAAYVYYKILLHQYPDDPVAVDIGQQNWVTFLEWIAPWILTAATAVYWAKTIYTRNLSYVIIGVLAACLLLRELHWNHTIKVVIYPLLGICFVWLFLWRDVVDKPLDNWRHTVFFVAALATYGLSQMVEKKVFGKYIPILPDFQTLHTQFEEVVECAGHVLLLAAAVFGSWRRKILNVK